MYSKTYIDCITDFCDTDGYVFLHLASSIAEIKLVIFLKLNMHSSCSLYKHLKKHKVIQENCFN